MRTLSSYSIKFYFKGRVWFVDLWFFVVVVFLFFFFFLVTDSMEFKMENLRLNLKLLAYK